jgi:predicted ATPase with chaperone activity
MQELNAPFDEATGIPAMPDTWAETGLSLGFLANLALKIASSNPECTSERMAEEIRLPLGISENVMQHLYREKFIEIREQSGFQRNRYTLLDRGWEKARRLLDNNGYIGPAPITLDDYSAGIGWIRRNTKTADAANVAAAFTHLVLSGQQIETLGLVVDSGRSLFLTGPAGCGKTSTAMALHSALRGEAWVPYSLEVDGQIIRVFDPRVHHPVEAPAARYDRRWIKINRPLVGGGGEWTLDSMDLIYAQTLNYYEAPFQVKANNGVLIIDDFGRQRMAPRDLLNRWIISLENRVDYLTLHTGKKIQLPFEQLLVFATNLNPHDLVDEAFLRRIGYRLHFTSPSAATYSRILKEYFALRRLDYDPQFSSWVFTRYENENREMKSCEPRDLVERSLDICKYEKLPRRITADILNRAWNYYFGVGTQ